MRKKGLFSLFALVFAFALIAAACGSDDDGGSDESSGDSTTTTAAADDEGGDSAAQNTGDGTFTVGTLLPETGSLAFLGPPEFAGVDLAVADINEAGGVNGEEIPDAIQGDSGDTSTDIASQSRKL